MYHFTHHPLNVSSPRKMIIQLPAISAEYTKTPQLHLSKPLDILDLLLSLQQQMPQLYQSLVSSLLILRFQTLLMYLQQLLDRCATQPQGVRRLATLQGRTN